MRKRSYVAYTKCLDQWHPACGLQGAHPSERCAFSFCKVDNQTFYEHFRDLAKMEYTCVDYLRDISF